MFAAETTETIGIKPCRVGDTELLDCDKFAGITTVDVAAAIFAATSGMRMTTLREADKQLSDVRAFHGFQPRLTTSAQTVIAMLRPRLALPPAGINQPRGE